MAGLVASARLRELGQTVQLVEKGDRPGGAMLLSSGVVWRHHDLESFRSECPGGDPALQRRLIEGLDADLEWLRSLGAPVKAAGTGNPLTAGLRFDPIGLTEALCAQAGPLRLADPLLEIPDGVPVVLATGGFAANRELVRRHVTREADHLMLRAAPGATGVVGRRVGRETESPVGLAAAPVPLDSPAAQGCG